MPKLTIDGREIAVEEGISVMQACDMLGIEIPRFCSHKRLSVAGSCRMCLVEIEKMPKLAASCAQPCAEGMVVRTDTPAVRKARRDVMELLLINHPLDCPVCDQGGECDLQDLAYIYGADRGNYSEEKREVKDKNLGPLIKTCMTRCIHCTRCVRFADEIAGEPDLGGLFRGEHMEVAPASQKPITSELSGNLIDVCPVGALTAKPYAFRVRKWELKKTKGIDVSDAVGSNIFVCSKGNEVMRILPRSNPEINDEWISDKARFSFDGLRENRIAAPHVRKEGELRPASWDEAISATAEKLKKTAPERVAAIAGDLADCESMFATRNFMKFFGSPHMDCRQDGTEYDVSSRALYLMNSRISGIDEADAILLIGAYPRREAATMNARIYKNWRKRGVKIGFIGKRQKQNFEFEHLGDMPSCISALTDGKGGFAETLKNAHNPMIILGNNALARIDGRFIHASVCALAEKIGAVREGWNGFNILHSSASRVGGLDLDFLPQERGAGTHGIMGSASAGMMDVIFSLGADEIENFRLGKAFVVYVGHHMDNCAKRADVVLPSAAFAEKSATYVNTEGKIQSAQAAVSPFGDAKEDWSIIRDISEAAGIKFMYCRREELVSDMEKAFSRKKREWKVPSVGGDMLERALAAPAGDFYSTDVICRASPTMRKCVEEILPFAKERGAE